VVTKQREAGNLGENAARAFLESKGMIFIAQSFQCRYGEIDLIMQSGEYTVFVEVKTRAGKQFGLAREFVTKAKQNRIIMTAKYWLSRHNPDAFCRFDVVEVYTGSPTPEIVHLESAFY